MWWWLFEKKKEKKRKKKKLDKPMSIKRGMKQFIVKRLIDNLRDSRFQKRERGSLG